MRIVLLGLLLFFPSKSMQWKTIQRIQDNEITTYIGKNDRMTVTIDHIRRSKPSQYSGTRAYENVCNDGYNRCVHALHYKEAATYYIQLKQEWYRRSFEAKAVENLKKIVIEEDDDA